MRVLTVTFAAAPSTGGTERYLAELMAELGRRGHRMVTVVQRSARSGGAPGLGAMEAAPSSRQAIGAVHAVGRWSFAWAIRRALVAAHREGDPFDVIHVHGYARPIVVQAALAAGGTPLVWSLHGGLAAPPGGRPWPHRQAMAAFDVLVLPWVLHRVARFVVLGPAQQRALVERFGVAPVRVVTVANMVPEDARGAAVSVAAPGARLLALARLSREKRLQDLVAAVGADASLPGADIVGPDGGERVRLEHMASGLAPGRVRVEGPVSGPARLDVILRSAAVVLPSQWEGQPMVALEALVLGVPVVASEGASGSLPGTGVFRYPVGDVRELAAAAHQACSSFASPSARAALAAWARDNLPTVEDHADDVLAAYAEAVRSVRGPVPGSRRRNSKRPQA